MDMANDNYYKSQGSDFIKKIKCNNINVNVNGFNGATLPTGLSGLATDDEAQAADEGEVGASPLTNGDGSDGGRPSGSDSDSRFVCIDNNDNVVVEEPISELCEECFSCKRTLQTALEDVLVEFEFNFIISLDVLVCCDWTRYRYYRTIMSIIEIQLNFLVFLYQICF